MINPNILYQGEATENQYIFNFVLMNIIFIINYFSRKNYKIRKSSWLWLLVFCLYAYWDTDYFSFREIFYTSLDVDFRDPLYYYLSLFSFDSYIVFRFYIWGGALLLLYKTAQRLHLDINMYTFVFSIFFLLLFSYSRVSLGMAMYFYGLSCLLSQNKKIASYVLGIVFICCSYLGHRSMALPILFTPLLFVKFNKYTFLILLATGLIIGRYMDSIIPMITGGSSNEAADALDKYSQLDAIVSYNWKYLLTENLKNYGIGISFVYLIWRCYICKNRENITDWCRRLLNACTGIFIVSISLLLLGGQGANIMGYRFLYMLCIPITLIVTYLYSNKFCNARTLYLVLFPMILFSEGFILGKILS